MSAGLQLAASEPRTPLEEQHDSAMQELRSVMAPSSPPEAPSVERVALAGYEACKLVVELCESGRMKSLRRYAEAKLYVGAYEAALRSRA